MKITNKLYPLVAGIFTIMLFQSCQEDDDNIDQEPIVFPHTVYYSHTFDTEFRMWTNGHEVNTDNLNIQDYHSGLYGSSTPHQTELASGYIFTDDTLTLPGGIFGPDYREYAIRNDSIFFVGQANINGEYQTQYSFFTFGNHHEMRFTNGAFYLINDQTGPDGFYWNQKSYFSREDVGHINYYNVELEDFNQGDTLIIYNSTMVFN